MKESRETPRLIAPPPIIYFSAILFGMLLNHFFRADLVPKSARIIAGIPLTLLALGLSSLTFREFIRRGVSVDHKKPTTRIITTGPFRFSRNPLYLSGGLLVFGVGLLLDNPWIIGLFIPSIFLTFYGAILPEERYLYEKFGEEYVAYKTSVRRWV